MAFIVYFNHLSFKSALCCWLSFSSFLYFLEYFYDYRDNKKFYITFEMYNKEFNLSNNDPLSYHWTINTANLIVFHHFFLGNVRGIPLSLSIFLSLSLYLSLSVYLLRIVVIYISINGVWEYSFPIIFLNTRYFHSYYFLLSFCVWLISLA